MSIVRDNLMTRKGYTPYCGNEHCRFNMPRTRYIGGQFQCSCGWRSSFEAEFITTYEAKWADPAPQPNLVGSDALRDVAAERRRQIEAEGWTQEHDDGHNRGELVRAATAYALEAEQRPVGFGRIWPWRREFWKPTNKRRNLVKAAALIIAEIERLDRAGSRATGEPL